MMTGAWTRRRAPARAALCAVLALGQALATPAAAAEVPAQAARSFDAYARAVEARIQREISSGTGFLGSDFGDPGEGPAVRRRILAGEIPLVRLAAPGREARDIVVPDGLVHHWRGGVLVPGVTLDQALAELRSPHTKRHVQDDVLESRELSRHGDESRIFLKLERKTIVTATYNTEHVVRYTRLGHLRASSRSVAVRIAELEGAGTPAERERPPGRDRGFLWRLNSYWRYEQVPQGVIVELESLTLSRDIPGALRPIARPIIDAVARESMTRTLESVRARLAEASAVPGGGPAPR